MRRGRRDLLLHDRARAAFDGGLVADGATVVAIGSHEPGAREVDERLVARATVVVESRASALREAGDVIAAIDARRDRPRRLHARRARARRATPAAGRPRLFKSTGMAWEDLVLARAVHARGPGEGRIELAAG